MKDLKIYEHPGVFELDSGAIIDRLNIGYHTFGTLNEDKSNVVWVCHALTANSNVPEWWGGLVGPDGLISPDEYFIVCANVLGSCYGSTNPLSENVNGEPYLLDFPLFTMRDIVNAHLLLKDHLGIGEIYLCMGGSCGGQQVLEMALLNSDRIHNLFIIAASARETSWSIAIHTAQRMSIEADGSWGQGGKEAAAEGLKAARGIGLLTYRSFRAYIDTQTDENDKTNDLKAESYIRYQGQKLADRFNAYSYWYLTKALDTHHVGRGRGSVESALSSIAARTLVIGIDSDILIPFSEQELIAEHIPGSNLVKLETAYGHDGFLIEQEKIRAELEKFLHLPHGF